MCSCQKNHTLSCNCGNGLADELTDAQVIEISKDETNKQIDNLDVTGLALKVASGNTGALKDVIANTARAVAKRICTEGAIAKIKANIGYVAGAGAVLVGVGYAIGKAFSKKSKKKS